MTRPQFLFYVAVYTLLSEAFTLIFYDVVLAGMFLLIVASMLLGAALMRWHVDVVRSDRD